MENESRLKELEEQATARGRRLQEERQQKLDSVKNRIQEAQRRKLGVLKGRISRAEAISRMKKDLAEGLREWTMEQFVIPSLRTYQSQMYPLRRLDHVWIHQMSEGGGLLKFLFSWITEKMVDEAGASLEEGLSEKERNQKILEIDREIDRLAKEFEDLCK